MTLRPIRITQGHPEELEGRQVQGHAAFGSETQARREEFEA